MTWGLIRDFGGTLGDLGGAFCVNLGGTVNDLEGQVSSS